MRKSDLINRIAQWIRNAERNVANTNDPQVKNYYNAQIDAYKDVIKLIG